jgi:hypothetical protein
MASLLPHLTKTPKQKRAKIGTVDNVIGDANLAKVHQNRPGVVSPQMGEVYCYRSFAHVFLLFRHVRSHATPTTSEQSPRVRLPHVTHQTTQFWALGLLIAIFVESYYRKLTNMSKCASQTHKRQEKIGNLDLLRVKFA